MNISSSSSYLGSASWGEVGSVESYTDSAGRLRSYEVVSNENQINIWKRVPASSAERLITRAGLDKPKSLKDEALQEAEQLLFTRFDLFTTLRPAFRGRLQSIKDNPTTDSGYLNDPDQPDILEWDVASTYVEDNFGITALGVEKDKYRNYVDEQDERNVLRESFLWSLSHEVLTMSDEEFEIYRQINQIVALPGEPAVALPDTPAKTSPEIFDPVVLRAAENLAAEHDMPLDEALGLVISCTNNLRIGHTNDGLDAHTSVSNSYSDTIPAAPQAVAVTQPSVVVASRVGIDIHTPTPQESLRSARNLAQAREAFARARTHHSMYGVGSKNNLNEACALYGRAVQEHYSHELAGLPEEQKRMMSGAQACEESNLLTQVELAGLQNNKVAKVVRWIAKENPAYSERKNKWIKRVKQAIVISPVAGFMAVTTALTAGGSTLVGAALFAGLKGGATGFVNSRISGMDNFVHRGSAAAHDSTVTELQAHGIENVAYFAYQQAEMNKTELSRTAKKNIVIGAVAGTAIGAVMAHFMGGSSGRQRSASTSNQDAPMPRSTAAAEYRSGTSSTPQYKSGQVISTRTSGVDQASNSYPNGRPIPERTTTVDASSYPQARPIPLRVGAPSPEVTKLPGQIDITKRSAYPFRVARNLGLTEQDSLKIAKADGMTYRRGMYWVGNRIINPQEQIAHNTKLTQLAAAKLG